MLDLAQKADEILDREDIDGLVITHGTDTLEETAYFLNIILNVKKPVIVTGAMRNGSELGYDGPSNLSAAICTACSTQSFGRGVLVVMNNEVHSADEVTKSHTLSVDTFKSLDFGPLGIVDQDEVIYYRGKKHKNVIKLSEVEAIDGKVALIKSVAGMDSSIFNYYIKEGYDGIIVEAMGRGNVPPRMVSGIANAISKKIPVVIVSRCERGRVLDSYGYEGGGKGLRNLGTILGDNLNGQKARIKLMLILSTTKEVSKIKKIFEEDLYTNFA